MGEQRLPEILDDSVRPRLDPAVVGWLICNDNSHTTPAKLPMYLITDRRRFIIRVWTYNRTRSLAEWARLRYPHLESADVVAAQRAVTEATEGVPATERDTKKNADTINATQQNLPNTVRSSPDSNKFLGPQDDHGA